eukprot:SAG11_NODE_307_length_10982_cov_22.068823_10_plen_425_part_00
MVKSLQQTQMAIDERLESSGFRLFKESRHNISHTDEPVASAPADIRKRRPAPAFEDEDGIAARGGGMAGSDAESDEDLDLAAASFLGGKQAVAGGNAFAQKLMQNKQAAEPRVFPSDGFGGSADVADDSGGNDGKWREHVAELRDRMRADKVDLMALVYGRDNDATTVEAVADSDSDSDDIFRPVHDKKAQRDDEGDDTEDSSKFAMENELLDAWDEDAVQESIRNRFVTGDWGKSLKAEKGDDEEGDDGEAGSKDSDFADDENEIFGDFEDLETGETFKGTESAAVAKEGAGGAVSGDYQIARSGSLLALDSNDPHAEDRRKAKAAKLAAQSAGDTSGKQGEEVQEGEEEQSGDFIKGLQAVAEAQGITNRAEFAEVCRVEMQRTLYLCYATFLANFGAGDQHYVSAFSCHRCENMPGHGRDA